MTETTDLKDGYYTIRYDDADYIINYDTDPKWLYSTFNNWATKLYPPEVKVYIPSESDTILDSKDEPSNFYDEYFS